MTSFTDSYTRADSTGLGAAWLSPASGGFDVVSNQSRTSGTTNVILHGTQLSTDAQHVTMKLVSTTGAAMGAILGSDSTATHYYTARVTSGGGFGIYRVDSGVMTALTPLDMTNVTIAAGTNLDMYSRVLPSGDVAIYADYGLFRISAVDSTAGKLSGSGQRYVGKRMTVVSGLLDDDFAAEDWDPTTVAYPLPLGQVSAAPVSSGTGAGAKFRYTLTQNVSKGSGLILGGSLAWVSGYVASPTVTDSKSQTWDSAVLTQRLTTYGVLCVTTVTDVDMVVGDTIDIFPGATINTTTICMLPALGYERARLVGTAGQIAGESASQTTHGATFGSSNPDPYLDVMIAAIAASITTVTAWDASSLVVGSVASGSSRFARQYARQTTVGGNLVQTTNPAANGLAIGVTFAAAVVGSGGISSAEAFGTTGAAVTMQATGAVGISTGETFGSGGAATLQASGSSGIPTGEAFGTNASAAALRAVGATGLASAEAFGAGGIVLQAVNGSSGIGGAEAFGSAGASVQLAATGSAGIASAETFGASGTVLATVAGAAGISSAEAFGSTASTVTLQAVGSAGIGSAEAFGAGEVANGPAGMTITGVSGIVSAETFGAGLAQLQSLGNAGIPSVETFGVGTAALGIAGTAGLGTAEAFGAGIVLALIQATAGIPSNEAFGIGTVTLGEPLGRLKARAHLSRGSTYRGEIAPGRVVRSSLQPASSYRSSLEA